MKPSEVRVVFMGTSAFAVPSLDALATGGYQVSAVVTQPPRPAGRNRKLASTPVMQAAQRLGLQVLTPERLRAPESVASVEGLGPDVIVVAAYAQFLPQAILDMPRHGCLNVHGSLLPRWRGASPIQSAILAGDEFTGVSLMLMEPAMDTGPILAQTRTAIAVGDAAPDLESRLAAAGAALLACVLPLHLEGKVRSVPQADAAATYAPILRKEQGLIDWSAPALEICRAARAFAGWPGSYSYWNGRLLKVISCSAESMASSEDPGAIIGLDGGRGAGVVTGHGVMRLQAVALEGSRPMGVREFLAGHRGFLGGKLG